MSALEVRRLHCGSSRATDPQRRVAAIVRLLVAALLLCGGCDSIDPESPPPPRQPPQSPPVAVFRDAGEELGVRWHHEAGTYDAFPMPQIMGAGCALLDANGDERLDILFVPAGGDDAEQGGGESPQTAVPLWLQTANGSFAAAPTPTGLSIRGRGMGATTGDVDNDGDVDLVLTTTKGPLLFRNAGDGTFEDHTAAAGIASPRWSSSAVFTDYDGDGWLDLLVINYVDYLPGSICEDGTGRRDYCGPTAFSGTTDRLYRNRGGEGRPGEFEDRTVASGLAAGSGRGLGAIATDLTGDGLTDLYVANDMEPNRLWVQGPTGQFQDEAELRGCATDLQGRPQASMGSLWCDLTGDGLLDLFLTHLRGETNTLYAGFGRGVFVDRTGPSGLGSGSLDFTGFGTAAVDLDLDGRRDILVANGRVMRSPLLTPHPADSHWDEYSERNQIFRCDVSGTFRESPPDADPFLADRRISRGLATGDIDDDGDVDVVVANINGPGQVFLNVAPRRGHWLVVRAFDPATRRDAVGARMRLICEDQVWQADVLPNTGYQSSHDPRVHFGVGDRSRFDRLEITWPDGAQETEHFPGGSTDRGLTVVRGEGTVPPQTETARSAHAVRAPEEHP